MQLTSDAARKGASEDLMKTNRKPAHTPDAIASQGTSAPWIVETHGTAYPDLFTYNVVAPEGYQGQRCGVVSGLDSVADANLISAAPELLQALRLAAADLDAALHGRKPPTHPIELGKLYRAAILKAEGK